MRIPLDAKQFKLVRAWMAYSSHDEYGRFISYWVAFNALCAAKYEKDAFQPRADLDRRRSTGLSSVGTSAAPVSGTVKRDGASIRLVLDSPGPVNIRIAERYTEDIIFDSFARDYQGTFEAWLRNPNFDAAVDALRTAIGRGWSQHPYVVNMTKANDHRPEEMSYSEMKGKGVIVAWEDKGKLAQLKAVLYQVRNNIFHGEKVPGELNDDRIVKAATPVLAFICERLVPERPE